jgi:sulfur carrier protein
MKVNGKQVEFSTKQTIKEYLVSLKINPGTVAIEWNGEILDREKWSETSLGENDKMEIIKFVGGG